MVMVPLNRASPAIRNVLEEHRRVIRQIQDNIDRINQRFAVVEDIELDHGVATDVVSPFAGSKLTVKSVVPVYCLGVNATTGATYTTLGMPRIDWQPSITAEDKVTLTAMYPAPQGVAILYKSSNQTLGHGASVPITFDVNNVLSGDLSHSTTSNTDRVICNRAGFVEVFYDACFAFNTSGQRLSWVTVNDSAIIRCGLMRKIPNQLNLHQDSAGGFLEVAAGDYVNLYCNQSSGGDLDVVGDGSGGNSMHLRIRYCDGPVDARGRLTLLFIAG